MAISEEKQLLIHKERRKQIVDNAYYLFYTKGYKNTSIQDIASQAGISKGLIYRHFKNKEELLLSHREETDACLKSYQEDTNPLHSLKRFIIECVKPHELGDYIGQIGVTFEAIIEGDINNEDYNIDTVHQFGINFFTPIFKHGQELGQIKEGNPEELADLYWHLLLGYCFNGKPTINVYTPEQLADTIMHLFIKKEANK